MLDKKIKDKIIKKFKTHESDTGSTEIQIALLTEEIKQLSEHLKKHKKDFSSRRGLLKKVGERRSLLRYLEKENEESYLDVCKKLKIKVAKRIEPKEESIDIDEEAIAKEDPVEEVKEASNKEE